MTLLWCLLVSGVSVWLLSIEIAAQLLLWVLCAVHERECVSSCRVLVFTVNVCFSPLSVLCAADLTLSLQSTGATNLSNLCSVLLAGTAAAAAGTELATTQSRRELSYISETETL